MSLATVNAREQAPVSQPESTKTPEAAVSRILRSIRVVVAVAAFAALASACGKNVTGPSPESYGDGPNCVIINGHLICQ